MKYLHSNKNWSISKDYNIDKLLYLMIDRPNYFGQNYFIWTNKKEQYHRNYDLPSNVFVYNSLRWRKNDNSHRENNKPAYISYNGIKEYLINGEKK